MCWVGAETCHQLGQLLMALVLGPRSLFRFTKIVETALEKGPRDPRRAGSLVHRESQGKSQ